MTAPEILTSYVDALGTERCSPDWAIDHVQSVLAEARPRRYADVVRIRAGTESGRLKGVCLRLDDGGEVTLGDQVPDDLPFGYHHARLDGDDRPVLVLHAPAQTPVAPRGWVIAAQLYSARSADSWGHGDLRDAQRLSRWMHDSSPASRPDEGHRSIEGPPETAFLMLNPLHAAIPGPFPQPSPYFSSSRIFRNPLYLCIDDVLAATKLTPSTDASALAESLRALAGGAEKLNSLKYLDRNAAWVLKREALVMLWNAARKGRDIVARVDGWLGDPVNRRYADYCVQAEAAGGAPPAVLVEADSSGDSARGSKGPRVTNEARFHAWLQVMLEDQLLAIGGSVIQDVAVGTDRAGADSWLWPECYVLDGTRIGCPPDQFNTLGQDWGLPPFHPAGLRGAGYEPFVRAVRSAVTGSAGIRLDHVMGLERLFWIPEQGSPPDGVYVQYQLDEMLDIVAIEAHRGGAFVVGEDLGTVPPSVPIALSERAMLSYRIMSLDGRHPHEFPETSMAALTTHDLATTVGLLSGSDLADQNRLELSPNESDTWGAVDRLRWWIGASDEATHDELMVDLYRLLTSSPSLLVAATLEDLALMAERPNMPGTIDAWPNWSIGLPQPLGEVLASGVADAVRQALSSRVS